MGAIASGGVRVMGDLHGSAGRCRKQAVEAVVAREQV